MLLSCSEREQEERCVNLREQARAACRCASEETKGYQKTWKKPKNTVVQEAIWGTHPVENLKLFEILLTAGHMISLFFYRTGLTVNDAEMCLKRFLEKCPEGIPDAEFKGRGEFGDYFTHITGHQNQ